MNWGAATIKVDRIIRLPTTPKSEKMAPRMIKRIDTAIVINNILMLKVNSNLKFKSRFNYSPPGVIAFIIIMKAAEINGRNMKIRRN